MIVDLLQKLKNWSQLRNEAMDCRWEMMNLSNGLARQLSDKVSRTLFDKELLG